MSFTAPPAAPEAPPPAPSRDDPVEEFDPKANRHVAWLGTFVAWLITFRTYLVTLVGELTAAQKVVTDAASASQEDAGKAHDSELAAGRSAGAAHDSELAAGRSAGAAHDSELTAGRSAGAAHDSELAAGGSAGRAHDSELAAGQSVLDAKAQADKLGAPIVGTSTTSIPVQPGPVVLDVGLGKGFAPGQYVAIARTAVPSTALRGLVTNYTNAGAGPLSVTVDKTDGEGTYAAWTVSLAGRDALAAARERVLVNTAAVTLEHGKDYVLIFAGAVTVTMPAAPTWGGPSIGLMVANGRTDNAVAFNGAKHQGIADAQMSIDDPFASFQLVPLNATYGWGIA
ncbi:hypothetical protein ACFX58_03435 [Sphingomonas sp. NCPPB 2930]